MGKIYLVPTPIGNLDDITLRAIKVLGSVEIIVVEDSRVSSKLLKHLGIEKRLMVYHEFNKDEQLPLVLAAAEEGDIAVITDAGTPGISDPGFELIRAAIERGVEVTPLPGPTALIPALVASGLATDKFVFWGFLPKKDVARDKVLVSEKDETKTILIYESPFRVAATLKAMYQIWGERHVCVAREISKKFEELVRLPLSEARDLFADKQVEGEVVIVVEGASKKQPVWSEEEVKNELTKRMGEGKSLSSVARELAKECGWNRKQVYELGLEIKKTN